MASQTIDLSQRPKLMINAEPENEDDGLAVSREEPRILTKPSRVHKLKAVYSSNMLSTDPGKVMTKQSLTTSTQHQQSPYRNEDLNVVDHSEIDKAQQFPDLKEVRSDQQKAKADLSLIRNRVTTLKNVQSKMLKKIEIQRKQVDMMTKAKQQNMERFNIRAQLEIEREAELEKRRQQNRVKREDHARKMRQYHEERLGQANIKVLTIRAAKADNLKQFQEQRELALQRNQLQAALIAQESIVGSVKKASLIKNRLDAVQQQKQQQVSQGVHSNISFIQEIEKYEDQEKRLIESLKQTCAYENQSVERLKKAQIMQQRAAKERIQKQKVQWQHQRSTYGLDKIDNSKSQAMDALKVIMNKQPQKKHQNAINSARHYQSVNCLKINDQQISQRSQTNLQHQTARDAVKKNMVSVQNLYRPHKPIKQSIRGSSEKDALNRPIIRLSQDEKRNSTNNLIQTAQSIGKARQSSPPPDRPKTEIKLI